MSLGSLLSPAIAGVIYAVVGADGVYYTVAGLGVLAVAATTSIRPNARVVSKVKTRVAADIITGVRLLWSSHVVRMLLAIGLAFMLLSWPLQFLLPMFVVEVYHRESEALGLLVSTMGLGGLTGTLFIASLRESKRGLILLGAGLLSGLGLVLVASIPAYYPVVAIMVIVGLGNSGVWSLVQVLIMGQVEDEYRGSGDERLHDEFRSDAVGPATGWNIRRHVGPSKSCGRDGGSPACHRGTHCHHAT